jgi:MFS family permease
MVSRGFKKIATHLMEGAGTLSEFWIVGLLHEIGRSTKYYNGNVNQPHVGTFVTLIFTLFYIARIAGNLVSLMYAQSRRYVLVTYLLAIPAIIATFLSGYHEKAIWIVGFRCIIGFCTSFSPIMCMIRSEESKAQLVSNFIAVKNGKMNKDRVGIVNNTALTLINTIQFLCAYISMVVAAYFYTKNETGLTSLQVVYAIVIGIILVIFFIAFKFNEPRVSLLPQKVFNCFP